MVVVPARVKISCARYLYRGQLATGPFIGVHSSYDWGWDFHKCGSTGSPKPCDVLTSLAQTEEPPRGGSSVQKPGVERLAALEDGLPLLGER